MDPINIIQFSLYSKMMSESVNILDSGYISKNILIFIVLIEFGIKNTNFYEYFIEK